MFVQTLCFAAARINGHFYDFFALHRAKKRKKNG